jgi:putative transposase
MLQDVLARLARTSQAFFRRVQRGEQAGFPRFKGRTRCHSFTFKEDGNGARLDTGCLVLAKIGRIAVHWSRPLKGTPKSVTLSHEADGWYVSFSCAEAPTEPLPPTGQETGIDVGLKVFLLTADGQPVENPRHYRQAEKALKKAQQRVCRRKKGSKRRRKTVQVLARQHQHVRRHRHDCPHKPALARVRAYDTLSVAALQLANLSRRPEPKPNGTGGYDHTGASRKAGLTTSMHDAGWRHVLTILAYKILAYTAAWAGKRRAAVHPAYTAQECCGCGERIYTSLSVRTHVCTHCGLLLDRDANAALNSHGRGQRLRGVPALARAMTREPVGREPVRSVRYPAFRLVILGPLLILGLFLGQHPTHGTPPARRTLRVCGVPAPGRVAILVLVPSATAGTKRAAPALRRRRDRDAAGHE